MTPSFEFSANKNMESADEWILEPNRNPDKPIAAGINPVGVCLAQAKAGEETLDRVEKLEAEHQKAKSREVAEIAGIQSEEAKLNARIREIKNAGERKGAPIRESLEEILELLRQKTDLERRLEEMKSRHKGEEKKRQAEMAALREKERAEYVGAFWDDVSMYEEIVTSPYGREIRAAAWKALAEKYPHASEGLDPGDTEGLALKVAFRGITNSSGMQFVYVPAGTFKMGSPTREKGRDEDEARYTVTITKSFYIQATEVTQGQWRRMMETNPSYYKDCGDECPVERVSWNDCQAFIRKLNRLENTNQYRLPTEAEWEYACRAGTTKAFANGGITESQCGLDPNLDLMGWYCGNSGSQTHPVGKKRRNAWGIYDMHGNVWEWCEDWYGPYPKKNATDPTGPSAGRKKVIRGGSCLNAASGCRSAYRGRDSEFGRGRDLGFRLVRMVQESAGARSETP